MLNTYPKISIVTANFNGGKYLEGTILSILNQNYPNLEYIIIDGGSTDSSLEIIKKYEDSLAYWVSEKDEGVYHAIQKGFEKSTGEIMAWLNSDDLYHPNCLFTVAEIFSSFSDVNWLHGVPTLFDEMGRSVDVGRLRVWSRLDILLKDKKWLQQESTFWRRSLWQNAGSRLNTSLKYAADFELWLRFFRYEKLFVCNSLLGGFRVRSSNQLSLDNEDEYIAEAMNETDKEVNQHLSQKQRNAVIKSQRYIAFINRSRNHYLRFLKKLYYRFRIMKYRDKHFHCSEKIIFDKMAQKFKKDDIVYLLPKYGIE